MGEAIGIYERNAGRQPSKFYFHRRLEFFHTENLCNLCMVKDNQLVAISFYSLPRRDGLKYIKLNV